MAKPSQKPKGLEFRHGSWWARLAIPSDVRGTLGKSTFLKNLKTDDVLVARQIAPTVLDGWRMMISEARAGASPEAIASKAKRWAEAQRYARPRGLMASELYAECGLKFEGVDEYLDAKMAALFRHTLLTQTAVRVRLDPSLRVPMFEGVTDGNPAFTRALAYAGSQIAKAHHADMVTAEYEAEAFGTPTPRSDGPKPVVVTGTTLEGLFKLFLDRNPKRHATIIARNKEYLRRLGEFMGDGLNTDIGLVTKAKATAFWSDLNLFPARRSREQVRQNFNKVIAAQKRAQGTDAFHKTQTDETLAAWLGFYRQLFQVAVIHDLIASDPWVVIKHHVDKSALKGKPYSDDELKAVFGGSLFTGHQLGDKWRIKQGDVVVKDAKYWMPILGLFTGTRMSEVAASPLNGVAKVDGVWCLDLTSRAVTYETGGPRVKNSVSRRLVPIHKTLIALGFISYVEERQQADDKWLFPDLDHESPLGPRHELSKWWGQRQKKIGVDRTFHELRHTWKRAARDAKIEEQYSDLLSGHSNGSMGRKYGAGVDVKLLQADMDKISFPAFPLDVGPPQAVRLRAEAAVYSDDGRCPNRP